MSSPCPSWPFPVNRTTIETLVNPLDVSRANGNSSQRSIRRGSSATREYVASVPGPGCPSSGGRAISEPRRDTEPQVRFGVTPILGGRRQSTRGSLLGPERRRQPERPEPAALESKCLNGHVPRC